VSNVELDEVDKKILSTLQEDGRISYSRLGKLLGIPTSTAHDKVQRLVSEGIIEKFSVLLDESALGLNVVVIVGVETDAKFYNKVAEALSKIVEIVEVYGTTAQFDLMIKIQTRNRVELTQTLNKIRGIDGIDDIFVFSVLESFKDEHMRPLRNL
jgi:DNA-binding Lrp family transcriptional regulator